ncbi:MAG: lactonase family protein [Kofleriaceae bacterium]
MTELVRSHGLVARVASATPHLLVALFTVQLAGCAAGDSTELGEDTQDLSSSDRRAVYVMDNVAARNAVIRYRRSETGRLDHVGAFPTGGLGTGAGLGSQGSIVLASNGRWLYVVNAGSDELSSFEVRADYLVLRDVIRSGGANPISLTVHDDLLYVVNAGRDDAPANIAGFRIDDGRLTAIDGSSRPLSAAAAGPAQIEFDPSGSFLVVTEKATNQLTTYAIDEWGKPGAAVVTPSHGQTPFGFAFDDRGTLIVSEAFGGAPGGSALSSYRLDPGGVPQLISGSVPTEQTAACWVAIGRGDRDAFTTNTGSNTVSGYAIDDEGSIERFDDGGATASVGAGPTDMAFSENRKLLFVLNAADHSIEILREDSDGTLDVRDREPGLPASAVGMAAY